jgi:hypothetical protein
VLPIGMKSLQIFAAYLVLVASLPSLAVEATGFVRPETCSLYNPFGGDALHLTSIGGARPRKAVVIVFPTEGAWYYLLNTWHDTTGADCLGGDCEPIAHAKFRLDHISKGIFLPFRGRRINGVSGHFEIELSNAKKLEGSFKAKTQKPVTQLICE